MESCGVYVQYKLLGGTSQSTSAIVVVGGVTIDLLTNGQRKTEETNNWSLNGLNGLLLHLLGPFDGDRDFLDVVELLDRSEQVEGPALDATDLLLVIETVLEVDREVSRGVVQSKRLERVTGSEDGSELGNNIAKTFEAVMRKRVEMTSAGV